VPQRRDTIRKARTLRREMSLPEVLLWRLLRQKPSGVKFRRQYPAGPYVLDFYAPDAKLGIEIDGIAHDMGDRPERDLRRDAWLAAQGFTIVRIAARDVLEDVEGVASSIFELVRGGQKPLHHPADGPPPHLLGKQGGFDD
jgi:very-short-patch-repair endonuclease